MKKLTGILLFVFIGFTSSVYAGAPVWKISKGGNTLYIGGTIHLLGQNDYPLPAAFEKAYKQSSKLVFEADILKFQSPEYQKIFMERITYQSGHTIKDVIRNDTFVALEKFFTDRDMALDPMLQFKPGMLIMMLTVIEMKRLNIAGTGVDQFYINKGLKDKKTFAFLEDIDEQLDFMVNMGKDNPDEMIKYTLRDINQLAPQLAAIKKSWRNGDNKELEKISLTPWKDGFPELYQTLLVKRNHKWLPKIERMLKTKEIEFVMFGALHLVGGDGVLKLLEAKGYRVEQLQ